MPNVKDFDQLPGSFNSIEDPEWTASDLANVSSGSSPIHWPNLRKSRQNTDMIHNLITDPRRCRRIVLCNVAHQLFEILQRWSRPDYPEVHDRISSRTSS
jgi:hypothetical protein